MAVKNKFKILTVAAISSMGLMFVPFGLHAKPVYQVIGVAQNDTLNIRSGAGVANGIVGEIPAGEAGIEFLGDEQVNGKTRWLKIRWGGVDGWVSERYLHEMEVVEADAVAVAENRQGASDNTELAAKAAVATEDKKLLDESPVSDESVADRPEPDAIESATDVVAEEPLSEEDIAVAQKQIPEKEWVLQCGNRSPFWRVNIHPDMLDVAKGQQSMLLPITDKEQKKNRWNTAIKTVVKGKNAGNDLTLTIKYAYSRRCYDTLNNLRVPYKVVTQLNGEEFNGCCRAVQLPIRQLAKQPEEQQLSLATPEAAAVSGQ